MYEHYLIDTKKSRPGATADSDYAEPESYHDPDFDAEWNDPTSDSESGESATVNVSENPSSGDSEGFEEAEGPAIVSDTSAGWEEV